MNLLFIYIKLAVIKAKKNTNTETISSYIP